MASKEPEYPKAFWLAGTPLNSDAKRGLLNPIYANREKDEERLRAEGYTNVYPNFEYPKWLYHETESPMIANDAHGEKKLLASGYSVKPIAAKTVETVQPSADTMQALIAEKDAMIAKLLNQQGENAEKHGRHPDHKRAG